MLHSRRPFPVGPAAEAGRCWWLTPRYSTLAASAMTRWLSSVSLGKKSSFQGLQTYPCAHQAQEGQGPERQRHHPSTLAPVAQLSFCSLPAPRGCPQRRPFVSHYISLGLGKKGRFWFFFSKLLNLFTDFSCACACALPLSSLFPGFA